MSVHWTTAVELKKFYNNKIMSAYTINYLVDCISKQHAIQNFKETLQAIQKQLGINTAIALVV